jgi:hypothetical protein
MIPNNARKNTRQTLQTKQSNMKINHTCVHPPQKNCKYVSIQHVNWITYDSFLCICKVLLNYSLCLDWGFNTGTINVKLATPCFQTYFKNGMYISLAKYGNPLIKRWSFVMITKPTYHTVTNYTCYILESFQYGHLHVILASHRFTIQYVSTINQWFFT